MPPVGRLADLVFDCADAPKLAAFWAEVLGRSITNREDGWVSLSAGEDGHGLSFQEVEDYHPPRWPGQDAPQQLHLDVLVQDLASAEAEIMRLGAVPLSEVLNPGPRQWRIFADPAGHPFCMVTSRPFDGNGADGFSGHA